MSDFSLESYFPKLLEEVKGFAIFMIDSNAIIRTWNPGCELMKGYTEDEAVGQPFEILFPDFLREQNLPEKEVQLAKEKGRYESENWRRKKNGELFWACVVLTRIDDEQGNLVGYAKITQDHTGRKNYEDQLKRKIEDEKNIISKLNHLNSELSKSNSHFEEFAYASSHDLQAPLRKISYYLEKLKSELGEHLKEKPLEHVNRIEISADRMNKLINDLLTFSYVSKGMGKEAEIDLNQQINEVLEDLELDVSKRGVRITVERLPKVRGNSRQFQQLFQNLISNSIKYTKPDVVPEIHISSFEVTGSEAKAILSIDAPDSKFHLIQLKDNGIGFELEYAEDIFKVFTRLHSTTEYPGTGVGLSIVQKVVKNHNGYIWAESKPGEGAIFKILLPVD
jgi:PAS domain S-box-containing protein